MENRYIITLTNSDKLIAEWKSKALAAGQEKMSVLVKNAILNFIETGEFLDIGHIHFHPDNVEVKKGNVISLQTVRTPLISRWIEENRAAGLDVSGPIKLLLSKCISVVPDTEKEYFPPPQGSRNYRESDIMSLMKANAAKITKQTGIDMASQSHTQFPKEKKTETAEIKLTEPAMQSEEQKSEVRSSKVSTKHPGNEQVRSGLNSLLPQRASKKS